MLITLLTAKLQEMMTNNADTACAPNSISEVVYELCLDNGLTEDRASKIADACFELSSELVTTDANDDFIYL